MTLFTRIPNLPTLSHRILLKGKNPPFLGWAIIRDGLDVMRTYVWIALVMGFAGLVLWGWWYQQRRAWSKDRRDESMRRHVNKNY
jgi:hypothetical protein